MLRRGQTAALCATGACGIPGEPPPTPHQNITCLYFYFLSHYFIYIFETYFLPPPLILEGLSWRGEKKKVGSSSWTSPKTTGVALGDLSNFPSCLERINPSPSCVQHSLHKCKHFLRVNVIDFPGLCINQYLKMPGKDRETQLLQVL